MLTIRFTADRLQCMGVLPDCTNLGQHCEYPLPHQVPQVSSGVRRIHAASCHHAEQSGDVLYLAALTGATDRVVRRCDKGYEFWVSVSSEESLFHTNIHAYSWVSRRDRSFHPSVPLHRGDPHHLTLVVP